MPDLITQDNQMNVTLSEGVSMIGASLVVSPNTTFEAMEKAMNTLIAMDRVTSWCMGDAINAADEIFGEKASQLISMTGYSYSYMMNCSSMANRFPPEDRMNISFAHHVVVQKFDAEKRRKYLQIAIDNEMGVAEFKAYVRKLEGKDKKNDSDEGPQDYVFAVMEPPVQRGQLWEILSNEEAKELTAEQLESLGLPELKDQSKVIVIMPRFAQEVNEEQANMDLEDSDGSIKAGESSDNTIPFG